MIVDNKLIIFQIIVEEYFSLFRVIACYLYLSIVYIFGILEEIQINFNLNGYQESDFMSGLRVFNIILFYRSLLRF